MDQVESVNLSYFRLCSLCGPIFPIIIPIVSKVKSVSITVTGTAASSRGAVAMVTCRLMHLQTDLEVRFKCWLRHHRAVQRYKKLLQPFWPRSSQQAENYKSHVAAGPSRSPVAGSSASSEWGRVFVVVFSKCWWFCICLSSSAILNLLQTGEN